MLEKIFIYYRLTLNVHISLQNLQALMNECIGHVIGKPHSPVTGLYIGKMFIVIRTVGDFHIWRSEFNSVFTFFC